MRIDSRDLSKPLDTRHRTILENIDRYTGDIAALGGLEFYYEKGPPLPQGGFAKPTRYTMLNESQCAFLLSLMRPHSRAADAKNQIIAVFFNAETDDQLAKTRAGAMVGVLALSI